jgi:murein tripeptide amidase MpaA
MSGTRKAFDKESYDFDMYLRYDEMQSYLNHLQSSFSHLCTIEAYGTSHEGRNLLLCTVTDSQTGSHENKPAYWIDAQIHSVELTAGVAALYILHYLLTNFDKDVHVTEALKKRVFYIVPRVNPDGVEAALQDSPQFHRSSVRKWPHRL